MSLGVGDFLVFQLESGFGLLRLLAIDQTANGKVWHVAGYADLFPDVESAEIAVREPARLRVLLPHVALTNRAFESTQTARIGIAPLTEHEQLTVREWTGEISDRS